MEYIGFVAAFLTTGSFLPQAIQTIKTKDTKSISLQMYILFVLGAFLWFVYATLIRDVAQIMAHGTTTMLSGIILFFKFREKN